MAGSRLAVDGALAVCYNFHKTPSGGIDEYAADQCKQGAIAQYVENEAKAFASFTPEAAAQTGNNNNNNINNNNNDNDNNNNNNDNNNNNINNNKYDNNNNNNDNNKHAYAGQAE
jgi:hypothetical protein